MDLTHIAQQFAIEGRLVAINPTGSGNVNDTYLAIFRTTFDEHRIIIQRISRRVFKRPETIMENLRLITAHVHQRLEREADQADRIWQMPAIVPCRDGRDWFVDDAGEYWRALTLIDSSYAPDSAQSAEHAYEVGCVLGQFHRLLSDLDPALLKHPLPGFHVTPLYLERYDAALRTPAAAAALKASVEAQRLARFVEERREFAYVLQRALDAGTLQLRMVHGDPKVNNIMIDEYTAKGTAIIDLDTVSPGLIHCDFGDALRSICNPAGEEVAMLSKVAFDLDLCAGFCRGYMRFAGDFLTEADRAHLYDAIRVITFELGLRFFEDYLSGNLYFKVRYPEQNLNRARVQFRLCEVIEARERAIRTLLAAC
ncbi:MAG: aminoglycoside phosphotransferase family protein [Verrucomicrobia bacterium]|nr:aminoglycoside phosphotransferase family protein [Verrucomicrobiota bacterium]